MLIGYRAWNLSLDNNLKPILRSFTADYAWESPVETGPPPVGETDFDERISRALFDRDPSLGFFSFNNAKFLFSMLYEDDMEDSASGIIQPFGLVRKFEKGFRSQSAQILALSVHVKCALAECSSSADFWVVHKNNHRMTGLCSSHADVTKDTWMKTLCGENPAMIDRPVLFAGLSNRYQCDIIEHSELTNIKENYGSW